MLITLLITQQTYVTTLTASCLFRFKYKNCCYKKSGKVESTAFRPDYDIGWDDYIKRLPTQKTPPMN
ncbi:hypothetical protein [Frischella perrara]|uniref:hypothetical protein n=1 Tax=Frischella perrara TaxID=1267021 RepID=UPI0011B1F46E|nr:hypothetical protein [Frischella perrara]